MKKFIIIGLMGLYIAVMTIFAYKAVQSEDKQRHIVKLINNGVVVKQWIADGSINAHDGYHFKDDSTKKYVTVQGTVIIEEK